MRNLRLGKEKINWSPVESPKIIGHLDAAAEAILRLDTESYRNDSSTKYVAFTKGKRRTVVCVYLSKRGARISVGRVDGKTTIWPKELNYRVTEDGYSLKDKSVKLTTIVAKRQSSASARGSRAKATTSKPAL